MSIRFSFNLFQEFQVLCFKYHSCRSSLISGVRVYTKETLWSERAASGLAFCMSFLRCAVKLCFDKLIKGKDVPYSQTSLTYKSMSLKPFEWIVSLLKMMQVTSFMSLHILSKIAVEMGSIACTVHCIKIH